MGFIRVLAMGVGEATNEGAVGLLWMEHVHVLGTARMKSFALSRCLGPRCRSSIADIADLRVRCVTRETCVGTFRRGVRVATSPRECFGPTWVWERRT